ncbi:MAG: metallophosphoesterase family protein [Myxococcaceae bacterium]
MRFLHISDVHVTTDYAKVPFLKLGWRRWIAMAELTVGGRGKAYASAPGTLQQIIRDFSTRHADHLLCTGDFTGYAMEDEFRGARDALKPLTDDPARCTAIPGNHDTYTPGSRKEKRWEKYFGHLAQSAMPEYVREDDVFPFVKLLADTAVIGLMSARVPPVPGLSYGVIGEKQLSGLRDILADKRLDGKAVLILVHHAPLTKAGEPDKFHHGLVDARKLFELAKGDRFAVLHGHIHKRYHHPADATRPHVFGAGSSTQLGHEGYWVIETEGGRVKGGTMFAPGAKLPTAHTHPAPSGGAAEQQPAH